jgi:hypothetical protein
MISCCLLATCHLPPATRYLLLTIDLRPEQALMEKLEADSPGSSKGPPPLGPKLRVQPGPTYKEELGKYAFLFPGADSAVVRTSQRALWHGRSTRPAATSAAPEPYLTPQFGASFCVSTRYYAAATAAVGMLFG